MSALTGDLVRTILIMSLSGSVLAVVLLLIRPFVRYRLPRPVQYGLWFVVLAALLIPVSKFLVLPERAANISLAPLHAVIENNITKALSAAEAMSGTNAGANAADPAGPDPAEGLNTSSVSDPAEGLNMSSGSDLAGVSDISDVSDSSGAAEPSGASVLPERSDPAGMADPMGELGAGLSANSPDLFMWGWIGFIFVYPFVVLLVLLYNIITYAYFMGKMCSRKTAPNSDYSVFSGLCGNRPSPQLYLSALAATPMLVGLFRPMIILPDQKYTKAQLQDVLLHELTHLRRRDVAVKWLSIVACALHWFNPIVWLIRREIDRACELSCDAAVVRGMNGEGRKRYCDTLMIMAAKSAAPRAVLSVTLCEEKKALKERLLSIAKFKPRRRRTLVASTLMIVAAMGAVCLLGASTTAAGSQQSFAATHNTSTVTYNYEENGGASATMIKAAAATGDPVDLTPTAAKENGWIFVGWNTDPGAAEGLTSLIMGTENMTLYAIYAKTLTATLEDYDGTIPTTRTVSVTIYNKATDGTVLIPVPNIYTGWSSRGWGLAYAADTDVAVVSGPFTLSDDVTLYGLYQRTPPAINSDLIANGDFESPDLPNPFVNFRNAGDNTFAFETNPAYLNTAEGIRNGKSALRIQQNRSLAPIGHQTSLERDCRYNFEFDILLLTENATNIAVSVNFVFYDENCTNNKENHHWVVLRLESGGGWHHIVGSYTPLSERIADDADLENVWFSIFLEPGPVTYLLDNVKLIKRGPS
ncbi:MAG: InlB B-repeat-containing protein [Gracilibacteraceae bacterium]|jgi:beta-lactamase regulating signal transducer with metallopeptidase domain|nr:InlB B-repeat-containing protein [Gracilibacteraceae bacterium]